MLQVCFPNVLAVSFGRCICCSGYTHILQVYVPNVSPISDVCCKCVYLDVAVIIHICCKRFTWFQYVTAGAAPHAL
jgi:hypothetical protein